MMGKGSVNHNTRVFTAKNVDRERSRDNVEFCHSDIKGVYHTLFDDALERYNAKQKRSDRKIDDYYEKIRRGKQEKLFYEVIFQIGNKDDMNVQSKEGQLAKDILCEFMEQFQKRNPNLYVFSSHLHMDEQTPHIHIDFVPFIRNSKRGLDTRVSLKGALAEQGYKGGTRGMTEWNQWIEVEKQELSKVMERYDVQWKQLGTHNKHLSVLDFEKQERQKEVAELEQTISGSKEELSDILHQQIVVGRETEQMRKEGEAIRQEVSELSTTNLLLKEQTKTLAEDKEKLLSENEKLEKQQKKLQQEINKMVQSKEVMERNIHAYDEDTKWQLPEPGTLMSAKVYRDKKALPLVERLIEVVKSLTIKCVQLAEQGKKLTAKVDKQQKQISRLTDKVMEQNNTIERLQEKASDFGRLERHLGREQVQLIVERSKVLEQAEKANKRPKHAFEMSR
ncbi:MAG: recombinase [Roseburia sp.]|nr:recombinase [Roseburia sp.]